MPTQTWVTLCLSDSHAYSIVNIYPSTLMCGFCNFMTKLLLGGQVFKTLCATNNGSHAEAKWSCLFSPLKFMSQTAHVFVVHGAGFFLWNSTFCVYAVTYWCEMVSQVELRTHYSPTSSVSSSSVLALCWEDKDFSLSAENWTKYIKNFNELNL